MGWMEGFLWTSRQNVVYTTNFLIPIPTCFSVSLAVCRNQALCASMEKEIAQRKNEMVWVLSAANCIQRQPQHAAELSCCCFVVSLGLLLNFLSILSDALINPNWG
jgi:hypothetical protein